jgi:uncharacterized protein YbjT (DUF2867 family)
MAAWFADHWLRQAFCFSLVRRLDEVEVLSRLGGERSQPRTHTLGEAAELSGSFHAGYPKLVLAAKAGSWVVAVEDNGWEGARPEVGDVGRCLAALAVAASTGQHHDLTGPESLDLATIAMLAEREGGTPIRYVDLTPAEHCVEMAHAGEAPRWLYAFSTMLDSVRQQRWAAVSGEVARHTGRPPASVRDVLAG